MSVTFRSASSAAQTTTTNCTALKPTGTVAGDLLIAIHGSDQDGSLAAMTAPSGWTLIGSSSSFTTAGFIKVWSKVATSSEPSSYTFADDASADAVLGIVCIAAGTYKSSAPFTTGPTFTGSNGATNLHAAPSVTAVGGGLLVTGHFGGTSTNGTRSYIPPSGMTERVDVAPSGWVVLEVNTLAVAADGATGTKTAVCSSSIPFYGVALSIAPAFTLVDLTDSGVGDDSTLTVTKTNITNFVEQGTATDTVSVFATVGPITDSALGVDKVTVEEIIDVVLTDSATGSDSVGVADFLAFSPTDAGTGADTVSVTKTTFVSLTDSGVGADSLSLLQIRSLSDAAVGTDTVSKLQRSSDLADQGVGTDAVSIVVIPFTQVLPPKIGVVYELMVVARVPQVSGPPAFIEVDPIEWKSLSYVDTLSQPQQLTASCLKAGVPESIKQRFRNPDQLATELWLYRNGKVVFAGPLLTGQTSGEDLTLNAKGLLSYASRWVIDSDVRFDQVDQFTMVKTMFDQWQALDYGNYGIDTSTVGLSGRLRDGTYLRVEEHNVGQRVEEVGQRENGFDIEVDPASRKLQLWYPTKGVDRSSGEDAVVFDARNITSSDIAFSVAPGDLASEAYGSGTSLGADTTLFSVKSNLTLRAQYGRSAVTASWTDVSEQATLDAHTQGLLDARSDVLLVPGPKVRVTPDADLVNYSVGDTVFYELDDLLGVSGAFRIRSQTVTVTGNSIESVDLEFV